MSFSRHAPNSAKNRPQPESAIPEVTGGGKARRVSSGSVVRRAAFVEPDETARHSRHSVEFRAPAAALLAGLSQCSDCACDPHVLITTL